MIDLHQYFRDAGIELVSAEVVGNNVKCEVTVQVKAWASEVQVEGHFSSPSQPIGETWRTPRPCAYHGECPCGLTVCDYHTIERSK